MQIIAKCKTDNLYTAKNMKLHWKYEAPYISPLSIIRSLFSIVARERIDSDISFDGTVDLRIKSNDHVCVYTCTYVRTRGRARVAGASEIISDNSYAIGVRRHDCLTAAIQSAGSTYIYGADMGIERGGFH